MKKPTVQTPKESKAGAGIAGAGSGTLLIAIANSLPDDHALIPWLLYAAPSVSAFFSVVWLWCQAEIGNYMQDRKIRSLFHKAKITLEEALENPNTSNEHKDSIRHQLEELELIVSERHLKRIRSMSPLTISTMKQFYDPEPVEHKTKEES